MIQFAPALGGAAVVVVAAALALNFAVLPGIGGPSVGGPSPSSEAQSAFVGTWFSTSDRRRGHPDDDRPCPRRTVPSRSS